MLVGAGQKKSVGTYLKNQQEKLEKKIIKINQINQDNPR